MIHQLSRNFSGKPQFSVHNLNQGLRNLQTIELEEDQFEQIALEEWNVMLGEDFCPPGDFFNTPTDQIEQLDADLWTYEYQTMFKPLCSNAIPYPSAKDDHESQSMGFTGREKEDFITWYFKWYWRLDQTWSVSGTQNKEVPAEPTLGWMRSYTDGKYDYIDAQGKRFPDDIKLDWAVFDNFWLMYESDEYPTDWLPITSPATVQGDEDISCQEGYFVSETRKCLRCPPGCLRCLEPNTCLDCTQNFELVFGPTFSYCFPKCFEGYHRQTEFTSFQALVNEFNGRFFDNKTKSAIQPLEMMKTCQMCPSNCADCYFQKGTGRSICTRCEEAWFTISKDGKCERRDNGDVFFLETESTTVNRCDDILIRVPREFATYDWSITTGQDQANLNTQLAEVEDYFQNHALLIVPGQVTELLSGEITISVTAEGNGLRKQTGSIIIKILPDPFTLIYSSATSLFVRANQNVPFTFLKYFPKCFNHQYKVVNLAANDIQCTLLDHTHETLAELSMCTVPKDHLKSGLNYVVRVDHNVETGSGIKERTHFIGLQTETQETFCTFGFDELDVEANQDNFILNAMIIGNQDLVNYHMWDCSINDSATCKLQYTFYGGQPNTIQFKPVAGKMQFKFTIQKAFGDQMIDISSCSAILVVKEKVMPLMLYQQSGYDVVGGFYDFKHWYNFRCKSEHGTPDWMQIQLMQRGKSGDWSMEVARSDTELLVLEPYTMTLEKEYLLICVAMQGEKEGVVSKILSTHMFAEDFQFNVYTNNPDSALVKPWEQEITVEVEKYLAHQNRTMWCQMGFHGVSAVMPFTQRPPLSQVISSATQLVNTVLPIVPGGMKEAIDLYAECYDSAGQKRVKVARVSLAQASATNEPSIQINQSEPRLSDIVIYAMRYPNPTAEQMASILNALSIDRHVYDHDEMENVIQILFSYFQKEPEYPPHVYQRMLPVLNQILANQLRVHVTELTIRRTAFLVNFAALQIQDQPETIDQLFDKVRILFARKGIEKPQKLTNIVLDNKMVQPDPQALYEYTMDSFVEVKVENTLIDDYKLVLFSSMVRPYSTGTHQQVPRSVTIDGNLQKGRLLSPIFGFDVLSYLPGEKLKEGGWIFPVTKEGMKLRVKLPIIGEAHGGSVICAAHNAGTKTWTPVELCADSAEEPGFMNCCSSQLSTSFALMSYNYQMPEVAAQPANFPTVNLPSVGILLIFFVIFLLTAMVLEYQTGKNVKMCKEKSQAELAEKDSNLEDSTKKEIMKEQDFSSVQPPQLQLAEEKNMEIEIVKIGEPEEVKNEDIQIELEAQETDRPKEELKETTAQETQPQKQAREPDITFLDIFWSAFWFYNRSTTMVVRHEKQPSRSWLCAANYCQILIASTAYALLHSMNENLAGGKGNEGAYVVIVVCGMRFIQALFVYMQRSKGTGLLLWKVISVGGLLVLSGLRIYMGSTESKLVYAVILSEYTLVDFALVPLFMACSLAMQRQDVRRTVPYMSANPRSKFVICGI